LAVPSLCALVSLAQHPRIDGYWLSSHRNNQPHVFLPPFPTDLLWINTSNSTSEPPSSGPSKPRTIPTFPRSSFWRRPIVVALFCSVSRQGPVSTVRYAQLNSIDLLACILTRLSQNIPHYTSPLEVLVATHDRFYALSEHLRDRHPSQSPGITTQRLGRLDFAAARTLPGNVHAPAAFHHLEIDVAATKCLGIGVGNCADHERRSWAHVGQEQHHQRKRRRVVVPDMYQTAPAPVWRARLPALPG
jgi:hypothetical protein